MLSLTRSFVLLSTIFAFLYGASYMYVRITEAETERLQDKMAKQSEGDASRDFVIHAELDDLLAQIRRAHEIRHERGSRGGPCGKPGVRGLAFRALVAAPPQPGPVLVIPKKTKTLFRWFCKSF
mgnify:CR=1 FL=1